MTITKMKMKKLPRGKARFPVQTGMPKQTQFQTKMIEIDLTPAEHTELGKTLGCTPSVFYHYRKGVGTTYEKIKAIAELRGMQPWEFLCNTEDQIIDLRPLYHCSLTTLDKVINELFDLDQAKIEFDKRELEFDVYDLLDSNGLCFKPALMGSRGVMRKYLINQLNNMRYGRPIGVEVDPDDEIGSETEMPTPSSDEPVLTTEAPKKKHQGFKRHLRRGHRLATLDEDNVANFIDGLTLDEVTTDEPVKEESPYKESGPVNIDAGVDEILFSGIKSTPSLDELSTSIIRELILRGVDYDDISKIDLSKEKVSKVIKEALARS